MRLYNSLSFSIRENNILVELQGGGKDTECALRNQLAKEAKKKEPNGASFRWAVSALAQGGSELQLQVLPIPLAIVAAKPMLKADDVAVTVADSWPLSMMMWDGKDGLKGPVPIIYADQPEGVRSQINKDLDSFWVQLNKLMTRFLLFEQMSLQTAKVYSKKPRPGRAEKPFHNDESRTGRPRKKARTEEPSSSEPTSDAGKNT